MRRNVTAIMAFAATAAIGIDTFGPTISAAGLFKSDGQGRQLIQAPPATRSEKVKAVVFKAQQAQNRAAIEALIPHLAVLTLREAFLQSELDRQQARAEQIAREGRLRQQQAAARQPARPKPPAPAITFSGDLRALVAQYPWDVPFALKVLWCESRGDPNAENAGANGLFQILGGSFDPVANVAHAYQMYLSRGWQPWDSSRRCWS